MTLITARIVKQRATPINLTPIPFQRTGREERACALERRGVRHGRAGSAGLRVELAKT
jgi:hypothetical protein